MKKIKYKMLDISLPDNIFRMELFKDSLDEWACSLNHQEKYFTGATPGEAAVAALINLNEEE